MHRLMTKQDRQMAKAAMVAGKIKVQPKGLEQMREYGNGGMTGTTLPGEAFLKGSRPYTCRVRHGSSAKIEGHYASLWSGQPVTWTAYA